jgi:hypothetical protein
MNMPLTLDLPQARYSRQSLIMHEEVATHARKLRGVDDVLCNKYTMACTCQ